MMLLCDILRFYMYFMMFLICNIFLCNVVPCLDLESEIKIVNWNLKDKGNKNSLPELLAFSCFNTTQRLKVQSHYNTPF